LSPYLAGAPRPGTGPAQWTSAIPGQRQREGPPSCRSSRVRAGMSRPRAASPTTGPSTWPARISAWGRTRFRRAALATRGRHRRERHGEDEIYVVQGGSATLVTDSGTAQVNAGSVIFVPAGEQHRFTDVREDLALLVIFAPPYGSRAGAGNAAPAPSSS